MNLLVWFHFDESGEITRIGRIEVLPPGFDLDKHFEDYMSGVYAGGGIDGIRREHVVAPERLLGGVAATSFVLYHQGKRFAAAMPYFQTITKVRELS